MQKLGLKFYLPLVVLTAGVLGMLAAWLTTGNDVFLYVMLGLFPVYLFHLIYGFMRSGREQRVNKEARDSFGLLAGSEAVKYVYITYLGNERRLKRPSARKKDYLVEFYAETADPEALKRHLWYGLSEGEEAKLKCSLIGGMEVPQPYLDDLKGAHILVQEPFLRTAQGPAFERFLHQNGNTFEPYGN